jgi:hypothetical protein
VDVASAELAGAREHGDDRPCHLSPRSTQPSRRSIVGRDVPRRAQAVDSRPDPGHSEGQILVRTVPNQAHFDLRGLSVVPPAVTARQNGGLGCDDRSSGRLRS